jgi:hypothetical protein
LLRGYYAPFIPSIDTLRCLHDGNNDLTPGTDSTYPI